MRKYKTIKPLVFMLPIIILALPGCFSVDPPDVDPLAQRYLIINADDLGFSECVDKGIVRSYREGVLTSTTAMINMPGAVDVVRQVHSEYPGLAIGLHLNITTGSPVLDPDLLPGLTDDDGNFFDINDIPWQLSDISTETVKKELMAQAELFLSSGVKLSHLDYHHHIVSIYSPFYEVVMDLAEELDVPVRNPVPASVYNILDIPEGGGSSAARSKMIRMGLRRPFRAMRLMRVMNPGTMVENNEKLMERNIPAPDWFIDYFFHNATRKNFISIIEQLPPGVSEIMTHPRLDPGDDSDNPTGYDHGHAEMEILVSPEVREKIDELGIILIDFTWLQKNKN
jgi:predicted glycoside hydrolase/deacetylase ChbG (UPF0249 family)